MTNAPRAMKELLRLRPERLNVLASEKSGKDRNILFIVRLLKKTIEKDYSNCFCVISRQNAHPFYSKQRYLFFSPYSPIVFAHTPHYFLKLN